LKSSRKYSSDEESLNYEDNADLASTITKLRQLLADRSAEDSSSTEDSISASNVPTNDSGLTLEPPKKLFLNISISEAEFEEATEFTIHYDGIYPEGDDSTLELGGYQSCKKSIHRKMAEFANLQSRLEANSHLKQSAQQLKMDGRNAVLSKWLSAFHPFGTNQKVF
jgi:hypothetical protein